LELNVFVLFDANLLLFRVFLCFLAVYGLSLLLTMKFQAAVLDFYILYLSSGILVRYFGVN